MSTGNNMDTLTALFISTVYFWYRFDACFAVEKSLFLVFFYKFMVFEIRVKDTAGTIDHAQNAQRCNSAPNHLICVC